MPVQIKASITKDDRGKFEGFRLRIDEWEDDIPLKFLLKSELPKLEGLLRRAYDYGVRQGRSTEAAATIEELGAPAPYQSAGCHLGHLVQVSRTETRTADTERDGRDAGVNESVCCTG